MIVIDCSVLIAGTMKDESHFLADDILKKIENDEVRAAVPSLFFAETANVLVSNVRRNRITMDDVSYYVELYKRFPVQRQRDGEMLTLTALAIEHNLSVYDASYLELAKRNKWQLATLDKKLQNAAEKEGLFYQR